MGFDFSGEVYGVLRCANTPPRAKTHSFYFEISSKRVAESSKIRLFMFASLVIIT